MHLHSCTVNYAMFYHMYCTCRFDNDLLQEFVNFKNTHLVYVHVHVPNTMLPFKHVNVHVQLVMILDGGKECLMGCTMYMY